MDWLIATPAWGDRCVGLFLEKVLPATKEAAKHIKGTVRFMVHTDQPKQVKRAIEPFEHRVIPIPKGHDTPHVKFGKCHREAIAYARFGECIAFINADIVPSVEVFAAAERRFNEGNRMIMMAATRTLGGDPPVGARSAALLRWTMENKHPSIRECFWETGHTTIPWAVYFQRGDEIVLHGFHLHPFAAMKVGDLNFQRKTIDADLAENFDRDQIHVVTDADEAALAEMSPPWRIFKLRDSPITADSIAEWAKGSSTSVHFWMFKQRIAICGSGQDVGDGAVCEEVLRRIG